MEKLKYLIKIFIILNCFNQISSNFHEETKKKSEVYKKNGERSNNDCGYLQLFEHNNCSSIANSAQKEDSVHNYVVF